MSTNTYNTVILTDISSFSFTKNPINQSKYKKITTITLMVISILLIVLGFTIIVLGASSSTLVLLILGLIMFLIGISTIIYNCKTFYHLLTTEKPSPNAKTLLLSKDEKEKQLISLEESLLQVLQPHLPESSVTAELQSNLQELLPQVSSKVDIQSLKSSLPQVLSLRLPETSSSSLQIPFKDSTPSLPLSLFNQVFFNPLIFKKILSFLNSDLNPYLGLERVFGVMEMVNPKETSFATLNQTLSIQRLSLEIGFNSTNYIFKRNCTLTLSPVDYIQEFSQTLLKVFLLHQDLPCDKRRSVSDLINSPEKLNKASSITVIERLPQWLLTINLVQLLERLITSEERHTSKMFCAFIYNFFKKPIPEFKTTLLYIHELFRSLYQQDVTNNMLILKNTLRIAIENKRSYAEILLLLLIINVTTLSCENKNRITVAEIKALLDVSKNNGSSKRTINILKLFIEKKERNFGLIYNPLFSI